MLVLLTTPGAVLPDELMQDVLVLDEPLPGTEDLFRIFEETVAGADVPQAAASVDRVVDAMLGLAGFPAEQVLAMSLSEKRLDLEQLWGRKRQVIEQRLV